VKEDVMIRSFAPAVSRSRWIAVGLTAAVMLTTGVSRAAAQAQPRLFNNDAGMVLNFIKLFKSSDPAGAGNVLYVFVIDPSVKGADYTITTILAEAFPQEVQALYKQYSEAYAQGQNIVNLALTADLGK
jgi:hypothetical protein